VSGLVEHGIAGSLTAHREGGSHSAGTGVDDVNFLFERYEDIERVPGPIEQQLGRMGGDVDVINVLVSLCIDDTNLALFLPGIVATIADIEQFCARVVGNAVRPGLELD